MKNRQSSKIMQLIDNIKFLQVNRMSHGVMVDPFLEVKFPSYIENYWWKKKVLIRSLI